MASLRKESSNRILGCDGRREDDAAAADDDDDVMEQLLVEAVDLVTDGTLWWW